MDNRTLTIILVVLLLLFLLAGPWGFVWPGGWGVGGLLGLLLLVVVILLLARLVGSL